MIALAITNAIGFVTLSPSQCSTLARNFAQTAVSPFGNIAQTHGQLKPNAVPILLPMGRSFALFGQVMPDPTPFVASTMMAGLAADFAIDRFSRYEHPWTDDGAKHERITGIVR